MIHEDTSQDIHHSNNSQTQRQGNIKENTGTF